MPLLREWPYLVEIPYSLTAKERKKISSKYVLFYQTIIFIVSKLSTLLLYEGCTESIVKDKTPKLKPDFLHYFCNKYFTSKANFQV